MTTTIEQLRAELPAALSRHSGRAWTLRPDQFDNPGYMILDPVGGAGLALVVYASEGTGKARASASMPTDVAGDTVWWRDVAPFVDGKREAAPEAFMSLDKSPDQIARDIVRRVLPALERAWPWFQEAMARTVASLDKRASTLAAIKAMGGTYHAAGGREAGPRDTVYCYLKVGPGGNSTLSVEVDQYGNLRVPHFAPSLDVLQAIVAALRPGKES